MIATVAQCIRTTRPRRLATFARARAEIKLPNGRLCIGASGLLLGFGFFSPAMAESLRSRKESCALVPIEKIETKWKSDEVSTGELFLRLLSLLVIFTPLIIMSPLFLINNERLNAWIYQLLRNALSSSGPLFIKWGQWASTRYDLLPLVLCNELNILTQNAPQHSWEYTDRLLQEQFKGDYTRCLKVEKKVLASGSIGQIYQGTLGDNTVVVKVQHPNIAQVMEKDIVLINHLCNGIDFLMKIHSKDIFRQFAMHLHDQLDFRQEKKNLEKFRKNFEYWRFVCFPKPCTASEKVIIESFEPGHSVIEYLRAKQEGNLHSAEFVSSEMRKKIGSIGLAALLKMIMSDNFVHADLHPGNILIRPAPQPTNMFSMIKQRIEAISLGFGILDDMPQVCFIDAGLISSVDPSRKPNIQKFFKSLLAHDGGNIAQAILDLSGENGPVNSEEAKTSFVEQMRRRTSAWRDSAWSLDQRTGDCMKDALNLIRLNGIRLDTSILIPVITAMTLEGWQYELDPTISVLDHVQKQMDRQDFFHHLTTKLAHSMWKSAESNVGIDEESPPSQFLTDEMNELKQRGKHNPQLI